MNIDLAREKLTSRNSDNVIAALGVLGTSGNLGDLPAIVALVKGDKATVKTAAVSAACTIIRENLISRFNETDPDMRRKLGAMMAALYPTIVDELGKDLYSESDERRLRTLQIMGLLSRNPRVREICANLLKDRDVKIRATAINLLGKIVGVEDTELILSLLNDSDKRVRANTVEALESLGNKKLIPVLLRFRKDPSNRIRGNVLKALYNLGHRQIQEDILGMLRSNDDFMKASALWVVSQVRLSSDELQDLAGAALLAENEMVASNARKALNALESPRAKGYLRYLAPEPTSISAENSG